MTITRTCDILPNYIVSLEMLNYIIQLDIIIFCIGLKKNRFRLAFGACICIL